MAFPSYISDTAGIVTSGTSLSINYPASIAAGDDLIVFMGLDQDDASGTTISGFTRLAEGWINAGSQSIYAVLFHKIATGSESGSVSISFGGGANDGASACMVRVSGGDGDTTPLFSLSEEGGTANPSAPGSVLEAADYLVLNMYAMDGNNNFYSADPSGFTNIHNAGADSTGVSISVAYAEITGDGSTVYGDEAHTASASRQAIAASIAIKGGGVVNHELTPANCTVAVTGQAGAIAQVHALTPASGSVGVTGQAGTISQIHVLTPANGSVGVTGQATSLSDTGVDFSDWIPVGGYEAYTWDEGAAWTDIHIVDDLGLSEASPDIGPAIQAHFNDVANRETRIRYIIPAGTWNLATLLLINRDKKRLVGAGSGLTTINISGVGVIRFQGFDGSVSAITTAPSRGDTTVQVADASIAAVGETITIRQDLDDTVTGVDDNTSPYALGTITPEVWAAQSWEQIVEVTDVDTGTDVITFTPPLGLDYDLGKSPEVKRYNNVYDGGIEGLRLNVTLDHGLVALQFDRVRQCYARDVHIFDHAKMGIQVTESFEVEIDTCVIDGARDTGTGGNGYGVCIELGSSRVYVHDCMVKSQRHAYLIQSGASHNIIGYCYSASPSVEDLTDLSLHGHNVHHNLIEGCIFHGVVEINDFYTETQRNLIFRNRILGNPSFWDSTSRPYAFWLRRNSTAGIVGNRCETTSVARIFAGSEASLVTLNGNSDAPVGIPDSMYLSAKPSYWGPAYVWPPFAGDEANTIPAEMLDVVELVPADCYVTVAAESTTITQVHVLVPANGIVGVTGQVSALVQNHLLAPTDGSVAVTGEASSLVQNHTLAPASGAVAVAGEAATISQVHALTPANGSVAVAGEATTISVGLTLQPQNASVAVTGQASTITQVHALTPAHGAVSVSATTSSLGIGLTLSPADGSVAVSAQASALVQNHVLAPASGTVSVSGQTTAITQVHSLTPAHGAVAVSAEGTTIAVGLVLQPQACTVAVSATSPVLTQNHVLTPAPGSVAVSATSSSLGIGVALQPQDGAVSVSGQLATITQVHALQPQNGSVAIAGQASALVQIHVLVPASGAVAVTATSSSISFVKAASGVVSLGAGVSGAVTLGAGVRGYVSL